jgi:hypothetical protein
MVNRRILIIKSHHRRAEDLCFSKKRVDFFNYQIINEEEKQGVGKQTLINLPPKNPTNSKDGVG